MTMRLRMCVVVAAGVLAISCGGGGGGGGGGGSNQPITDDDARRAVLADLGDKLVLPTLQEVDARAATLKLAVDAWAAAPADAAAMAAAQAAWRPAMDAVQRAEVLQIGPAAAMTEPGGLGLEMQLHNLAEFSACAVHVAAYADQAVDATSPGSRIGMKALEYLLFSDADNPACAPAAGVDARARRAQYAARVATRLGAVATQLRTAWEPNGGNFVGQFKTAGTGSSVYATPQLAMNAVSTAIFYFEKATKDRKIAAPTGIGATELPGCPTVTCPEYLESPYARASGANIQANLQAFREVFTGKGGGMGLNSLMVGIGRADLATRFLAAIDAAAAGVTAGTTPDMEAALGTIPARDACLLASASRGGAPAVCVMHGRIDEVTDILRAEVVSTLNLRIPDSSAGDND